MSNTLNAGSPREPFEPSAAAVRASLSAYWRWKDAHDGSPANLVYGILGAAYAVDRPSRAAGSEEAHLYELLKKARGAVTAIVSIASLTETLDADRGYWERVEEEINAALRRAGDVRHEPERKGP